MKFAALNKESSNSSVLSTPSTKRGKPTLEAQESACLELYHSAIRLQQDGDFSKAKDIYRQILESEVMEEVGGTSQQTTLSKLKYLVLKNMATIVREQGDLSAALDAYIEASTIDTSDVTMWCQMASVSSLLGNLLLARKALECAMECNNSHWPALEALITILFALRDYYPCLLVIKQGFDLDPTFPRGVVYLHHICEQNLDLLSRPELASLRLNLMDPEPSDGEVFLKEVQVLQERRKSLLGVELLPETVIPGKKITTITMYNLASCLLALYKQCKELCKTKPSYTVRVDTACLLADARAPEDPVLAVQSSPVTKSRPSVGGSPLVEPEMSATDGEVEEGAGRKEAKRRLLDELETYAPKRRSTRVKGKSTPLLLPGQSHFEQLSKFIPSWLGLTSMPPISSLSPLKKQHDNTSKQSTNEKMQQLLVMAETLSQTNECQVVKDFIARSEENFGIIDLLKNFLLFLSKQYSLKWSDAPLPVVKLYTELYECLHPHLNLPSCYCTKEDAQQENFKNMAMVALCYLEAYVDCFSSKRGKKGSLMDSQGSSSLSTPKCFTECLNLVCHCAGLVGESERERVLFALRYVWWNVKWCVLNSDNSGGMSSLRQCERMLEAHSALLTGPVPVYLPNLSNGPLISLDHVHDKMRQLEQCVSVNEVRALYKKCELTAVVDRLLPLFSENSDPPIELLIGSEKPSSDGKSCLSLLLSCLTQLDRYHSCLLIALQATLSLLSHHTTADERWAAALKETFVIIDDCLPLVDSSVGQSDSEKKKKEKSSEIIIEQKSVEPMEPDNKMDTIGDTCTREDLLHLCDQQLLQRLFVCVIRTMDLVVDMIDSPLLPSLPVAVTWGIFHTLIACKWGAGIGVVSLPAAETEDPLLPDSPKLPSSKIQEGSKMSESAQNDEIMDTGSSTSPTTVSVSSVPSTVSTVAQETSTPDTGKPLISNQLVTSQQPFSTPLKMLTSTASTVTQQASIVSFTDVIGSSSKSLASQPPFSSPLDTLTTTTSQQTPTISSADILENKSIFSNQPLTSEQPFSPPLGVPTSIHSLSSPPAPLIVSSSCSPNTPSIQNSLHPTPPSVSISVPCSVSNSAHSTPLETPRPSPILSTPSKSPPLTVRDGLSPTLRFLIEAHHFLGRMGWCCKESGSFLQLIVSTLWAELKDLLKLPSSQREVLLVELEQCFYCLYGHPQKRIKARGLVEHNSPHVPLTWGSALLLIEYFHPTPLPSLDDTKAPQVTAELIHLYKRILNVLPKYGKVLSKEDVTGLIEDTCTESMIVRLSPHRHTTIMGEICYILADDALKGGYNNNAIHLYQQSLCYCPDFFTSWAGLALARTRKITEKLNTRDVKSGMERFIQTQTGPAVRCFEKAIGLNEKHCFIIEKFGFFCYMIQAFASHVLYQSELFLLKDIHSWASDSLGEMLLLAKKCFTQALSLRHNQHSEPWLYQLMLGKIDRKLSRPFPATLELFIESCEGLHSDGAGYPDYVELSAKHHALEAIEAHYQLHTFILKTLLKQVKRSKSDDLSSVELCLKDNASRFNSLPLSSISNVGLTTWISGLIDKAIEKLVDKEKPVSHNEKKEETSAENTGNSILHKLGVITSANIMGSEKEVLFPMATSSLGNTTLDKEKIRSCVEAGVESFPGKLAPKKLFGIVDADLIKRSLCGIALCSVKCPAYFKSLYRLAAVFFEMGLVNESRDILLGPLPSVLVEQQEKLLPLFVLKGNIFSNMWQIPTEEINRPGNFSTHAYRNLNLLLDVLSCLSDTQPLCYLAQQLKSKPDTNKQYMRDNERVLMFKKAVRLAVETLQSSVSTIHTLSQEELKKLQSVASSLKPLSKVYSSQKLTKDVDAALESLKSVIVPDSPLPTLSKDKDTTTLTITNTVKPDTSCETVQEVPMETVPALVASVNQS